MDFGGGEVSEDTWGGEGRAAGGEAMEAAGSGQRRHLEVEVRRAAPGSRPPCRAPPREPYGLHAARVMVSRDVHLSTSSFVRLYLPPPAAGDKRLPVVVYFHGGGFMIGSAASPGYRRCLNDLAAACPAVAVSHPLPAAYEDSTAALAWVLSVADPWLAAHGPLSRVFLAGDSTGGNIYHHLAMCHGLTSQHLSCRLKGIVMIHPWFWGKEPIGGEAATGGAEGAMGVRVPRRGGRRG
uniref:Alpha/beta hydrolase fold-3 domain-containing protein n=1 Tax=Oryza nivara TaxID=4536 RepID=A0A0E0FPR3_ORYNI